MPRASEVTDPPAPLLDHLRELRRRVGVAIVAVIVGAIITFAWGDLLIALLRTPLNDTPLYFVGIGDAFGIRMQLSLIGGVVLAMPIWLWQAWAFIRPGLTEPERRAARPWIPLALLLFLVGVGVAWIVLPFAVSFLLSFATSDLTPLIAADRYFGFVGSLMLVFGLATEYPILLVFLSRVGIITSTKLRRWRRNALVFAVVVGAFATPGTDLISPIVLAVVLYLLFELSIVLVRAGGR
ncbi:MAG: twin-arginine translocase subunit TatC [bacterium]|jgi:sec-independent protein translocase protein TatC|nr:twin-arginine translocase subunit TatC [Chloroflexota bacterium]NBO52324.1 twin-arginine translocase subunit TatC [Candidatus Aquidulcis sp.]